MSLKIGELFVALGFKVDQPKIDYWNQGLENSRKKALKVAAAATAASFAIIKLSDSAVRYAVVLKNFAVQTGLSVAELEKWRRVAEMNDVSGGELIETIKGIQSAQSEIRLGGGNIRPWQLLGISPNENPFRILEQVRESIKNIDPAIAASVIGQMGIGQNFLNILRLGNLEFDKLNEKFILTNKEQKDLITLNRSFKDLIWSVRGLRNRIFAINAGPLIKIAKAMKNVASFTMESIENFKNLSSKFDFIKKILSVVTLGIAAYFSPITAGVLLAIAAIDDLYVFLKGGESIIGDFIDAFTLGPLIEDSEKLLSIFKDISEAMFDIVNSNLMKGLNKTIELFKKLKLSNLSGNTNIKGTKPTTSSIINNINVSVTESATPKQTAKAVLDKMQMQFNDTYFQTPNLGVS
jgi:hypothetical protein